LYKESSLEISPILFGGSQEHGLRPGSENIPLVAGFAYAAKEIVENRKSEAERLAKIKSSFIEDIGKNIKGILVNGERKLSLPNVVNVSVPEINSEYIALALDHAGISISTKSSCLEGEEDESHVVSALRDFPMNSKGDWRAKNTLRFSFGRRTSMGDIRVAARELRDAIQKYWELDTGA